MTTVADRIAQLQQQAVERGATLPAGPVRRARLNNQPPTSSEPPEPANPWVVAAHRQRNNDWHSRPVNGETYEQREHARYARSCLQWTETRLVSRMIAACLGDGWEAREDRGESGYPPSWRMCLVHQPSGSRIRIGRQWNDDGRFVATPEGCYHSSTTNLPSNITMSASRTAASLARDIENRILCRGFLDEAQRYRDEHHSEKQGDNHTMARLAKMARRLGVKIEGQRYNNQQDPTTETKTWKHTEARISQTYHGPRLLVYSYDEDLLGAICDLLNEYEHPPLT